MNQTNLPPDTGYDKNQQSLTSGTAETLKRSFADDGYFVIRNVIAPEKLSKLHQNIVAEFDRAKQSGTLFSGGGLMSGHLNCFPGAGARFIYETLQERGIIALLQELHPRVNRMPNVGCNFNLPNSVTQHYHTDRDFTKDFLILNVAVVDTVVANGAIEMIPGTHKQYYPYWRFALQRTAQNSIRVPMKQGDIMVRTSNVWHRGMPNQTTVARPMIALTWEDGGSTQEDPFAVESGKITFRPNWFRPTRLGRIREQMFVRVPLSYSAFRFVRSLYGKKGY